MKLSLDEMKKVEAELDQKRIDAGENPAVVLFGPGPKRAKCSTCRFLNYGYCEKLVDRGAASQDHKVSWRACIKYEYDTSCLED